MNRNACLSRAANTAARFEAVHDLQLAVHQRQVEASALNRFDSLGANGDGAGFLS
jgi:hypothetical protein